MGFLKRIWKVAEYKAGNAVDGLESPEQLLDGAITELNDEVDRLRRAVAGVIADEKRLKRQIDEDLGKAREWESRAAVALRDGREDLARDALLQKHDCEARALSLQGRWQEQQRASEQLKASLRTASERVADAKRNYTLLAARHASAQANKAVTASLCGSSGSSAVEMMERLSEKISQAEAETEAHLELAGQSTASDLDRQFAELERKRNAESALDRLKEQLASH